jgi:dihydrofolate synthase/folylpolyglutamate synthase
LLTVVRRGGGTAEVLLDGAHNPAGATALAAALDELRPVLAGGAGRRPAPVTLVIAVMADKDVPGILRPLVAARSLAGARVVATQVDGGRALPAADLAAAWRVVAAVSREPRPAGHPLVIEPDPVAALQRALDGADGPIVVAGSLYLVGLVRARLVDDPDLRDPA